MKCHICDSETPPLYQQHGLMAVICHTCKAMGRVIESVFSPDSVEPEPAPVAQTAEATDTAAQIEGPAPAQEGPKVEESAPTTSEQVVDQEPTVSTEAEQPAATEADQTDVDTGKRKTKKLK